MKKIICILLLSVCVTAGAAACGASREIALDDVTTASSEGATQAAEAATEDAAATDASGDSAAEAVGENEAEGDATPEPGTVCVYVCGEVVTPGVYELPEGARIYEALALAGGLGEEADLAAVNQAQELSDGMMIRIPAIGETTTQAPVQTADGGTAQAADVGNAGSTSGLVNINTADAAQLCTLPGIGETKAAAILAYREQHGSFASKEDLLNVSGIGESTYNNLESRIAVQ